MRVTSLAANVRDCPAAVSVRPAASMVVSRPVARSPDGVITRTRSPGVTTSPRDSAAVCARARELSRHPAPTIVSSTAAAMAAIMPLPPAAIDAAVEEGDERRPARLTAKEKGGPEAAPIWRRADAGYMEKRPTNADRRSAWRHLVPSALPQYTCDLVSPTDASVPLASGWNHCMAPHEGSWVSRVSTDNVAAPAATSTRSPWRSQRTGAAETSTTSLTRFAGGVTNEGHERFALGRTGALVHDHRRPHLTRRLAAHLPHAQIAVAGHGSDDREPVERLPVEGALADPPRQHGLTAHRFRFAVHDAAAGEDLGGARLDIVAGDGRLRSGRRVARKAPPGRCCRALSDGSLSTSFWPSPDRCGSGRVVSSPVYRVRVSWPDAPAQSAQQERPAADRHLSACTG